MKELELTTQTSIKNWREHHRQIFTDYHETCPVCDFTGIITAFDLKDGIDLSYKCPYCMAFLNTPNKNDFIDDIKLIKGFDSTNGFYGLCLDICNWYTKKFIVGSFQFYWDIRMGYDVTYVFATNLLIPAYREMKKMKQNNVEVPENFMQRKKEEVNRMIKNGDLYKTFGKIKEAKHLKPFMDMLKDASVKRDIQKLVGRKNPNA